MGFVTDKRWEVALGVLMPLVIPLADAYEQGRFSGHTIVTGIILGAIIVLRAAASHRQSPPAP